ncbi:PREDICTED: E3 ubiquitin-protein ligase RING1-like [Camelina sativa]|uniref:RING-type E3 ubiquitin transferase n=1 Tax=Camelina sativa TaxID=90675 RepID=A0ABM0X3L1_CAMSA|nr:PREDICTED: E3 ubiquitin-protein ligase RING1-like [Camelina sativa]
MEEAVATRYWCHMCSQTVDPVMEAEIKCPFCHNGFVEEMGDDDDHVHDSSDTADARANNSLWAPILMELMTDPVRRRRNQSVESVEDNQNETGDNNNNNNNNTDLDSQLQEILRRRRRHSAAVLQLLQGIRAGLSLESETTGNGDNDNNPERVILINPFNQTITVQTSADRDSVPAGSLGDYFIGPGFEMLLQRLAENDPNRYGTPPAKKEAVEALSTVKIEETLQCSVCLDDFEIGTEAKLMPCKHKFHVDCLLPWLELHSSCPVCRFQLPADEPKTDSATTTSDNNGGSSASATSSSHGTGNSDGNRRREEEEEDESEDNNDSGFSIPWPFSTLFSSSQDSNASTDSR